MQAHNRVAVVREIDVVGATKRLPVTDPGRPGAAGAAAPLGRPITRSVALPGTRLILACGWPTGSSAGSP